MTAGRTAWAAWALCACATLGTLLLVFGPETTGFERDSGPVIAILLPLALMTFPTVGALIASRTDRNPIGWLLIVSGVVFQLGGLLGDYGTIERAMPAKEYAAWFMHWTVQSPAIFSVFALLLLFFPTGRALSVRWSRFIRFYVAATATFVFLAAFRPGQMAEVPYDNPVGLGFLQTPWLLLEPILSIAVMVGVPVSAVSFILRFRRSRGIERQQMKWFASAAVLAAVIVACAPIVFSVEALWWLWPILFGIAASSLPIAIGIAVLRFRLYDIDRIISRAVAYVSVTTFLGAIFAAIVLAPVAVVGSDGSAPDYIVAVATLVVAALFRPVRRRVQDVVDRRFNRARYDAEQTLTQFTRRLREQIDIDALGAELQHVVAATMHPSSISLWTPR